MVALEDIGERVTALKRSRTSTVLWGQLFSVPAVSPGAKLAAGAWCLLQVRTEQTQQQEGMRPVALQGVQAESRGLLAVLEPLLGP